MLFASEKQLNLSYQRCQKNNLDSFKSPPAIQQHRLKICQQKNKTLIFVFENEINKIIDFLKNVYNFSLADKNCFINKTISTEKQPVDNRLLLEGTLFSEKNTGTTALSLAAELKKPVYLTAKKNYCKFLQTHHIATYPLLIKNKMLAFINISSICQLTEEILALTKLITENIKKAYLNQRKINLKNSYQLNKKQLILLKYLSEGLTEIEIASKMFLSVHTIKYHKRKIYQKFGVKSLYRALFKAARLDIIGTDEYFLSEE